MRAWGYLLVATSAAAVTSVVAPAALAQDPLADARVEGYYDGTQTTVEIAGGAGGEVGAVQSLGLELAPTCAVGACDVEVVFGGELDFTLRRAGSSYAGDRPGNAPDECGGGPLPDSGSEYELEVVAAENGIATELRGSVTTFFSSWAGEPGAVDCSTVRTGFLNRSDVVLLNTQPIPTPAPTTAQPTVAPSNSPPATQPPAVDGGSSAPRVPGRTVLAAGVATVGEVSGDAGVIVTNLAIAALLALFLVFPSDLFNKTLEDNYDEVRGWFRFGRRRTPGASPPVPGGEAADTPAARKGWLAFAAITAVTAVLYGLLDPTFGLNRQTAVAIAGIVASIVVLTLVGGLISAVYLRRKFGDAAYRIRTFPGSLVVAMVCVAVSRLAGFAPGYLYGLIAGFAFRRELDDDDEGRQTLTTCLALMAVSLVAWVAWMPIADAVADGGAGIGLLVTDAILASIFITGIEGLIFGLVPLKFLSGSKLMRWSKVAWGALYVLVLFTFFHVVVRPAGGAPTDSSTLTVIILFLAFGAVSVAFWAYFRFRTPRVSSPAAG